MLNILRLWPGARSRSGQRSKYTVFIYWTFEPDKRATKSSDSPKVLIFVYVMYRMSTRVILERVKVKVRPQRSIKAGVTTSRATPAFWVDIDIDIDTCFLGRYR